MQDEKEPEKHKPVPFIITCPVCGGNCKHIYPEHDTHFNHYKELRDNYNYFANYANEEYGIPHFRNNGIFGVMCDNEKWMAEDHPDTPMIMNYTTTQIKEELRRRKRNYWQCKIKKNWRGKE